MEEIKPREIIEGNHRAYYKAFDLYHGKLYQYVYKHTRSAWYAEETVQLSFLKLWERREHLSETHSLSTQLFRIAKSILIDLLRREKLRHTQELSDTFISGNPEEERLVQKETLHQVLGAIDTLPTQSRRVFKLSRFDDLSHKEIGDHLSISPKTVETHITKALKHLRKGLSLFF